MAQRFVAAHLITSFSGDFDVRAYRPQADGCDAVRALGDGNLVARFVANPKDGTDEGMLTIPLLEGDQPDFALSSIDETTTCLPLLLLWKR